MSSHHDKCHKTTKTSGKTLLVPLPLPLLLLARGWSGLCVYWKLTHTHPVQVDLSVVQIYNDQAAVWVVAAPAVLRSHCT